jgi:hypothetical protein
MRLGLWVTAVALAVAAGAGCGREAAIDSRLSNLPDPVRRPLSDGLWKCGSIYTWAAKQTLRCEITRTEHRETGDVATREIWLLDLASGHFRIERLGQWQVTAYNGTAWHVWVNGKETEDLELRAAATSDALLIRQIMPMPFSLLESGLNLQEVGPRIGPAEARSWDRLLATFPAAGSLPLEDRTLVEIDRKSRRLDAAVITWWEPPFLGCPYRVTLDEWWAVGDLAISHRWRFTPADETGAAVGRPQWTIEVTAAAWDVPVPAGSFSKP